MNCTGGIVFCQRPFRFGDDFFGLSANGLRLRLGRDNFFVRELGHQ
jgi:hypothetical protein